MGRLKSAVTSLPMNPITASGNRLRRPCSTGVLTTKLPTLQDPKPPHGAAPPDVLRHSAAIEPSTQGHSRVHHGWQQVTCSDASGSASTARGADQQPRTARPGPHAGTLPRTESPGIDCRLHERPFRLSQCIRPHSMVIWQRPLPESWDQWLNRLRWMRERGCLLLTEWDDHPVLFSKGIQHVSANSITLLCACAMPSTAPHQRSAQPSEISIHWAWPSTTACPGFPPSTTSGSSRLNGHGC